MSQDLQIGTKISVNVPIFNGKFLQTYLNPHLILYLGTLGYAPGRAGFWKRCWLCARLLWAGHIDKPTIRNCHVEWLVAQSSRRLAVHCSGVDWSECCTAYVLFTLRSPSGKHQNFLKIEKYSHLFSLVCVECGTYIPTILCSVYPSQKQHTLAGQSKDIVVQENMRDTIAAFGIALIANVAVLVVAASTFHNVGLVILTLQDAHALMEQVYLLVSFVTSSTTLVSRIIVNPACTTFVFLFLHCMYRGLQWC